MIAALASLKYFAYLTHSVKKSFSGLNLVLQTVGSCKVITYNLFHTYQWWLMLSAVCVQGKTETKLHRTRLWGCSLQWSHKFESHILDFIFVPKSFLIGLLVAVYFHALIGFVYATKMGYLIRLRLQKYLLRVVKWSQFGSRSKVQFKKLRLSAFTLTPFHWKTRCLLHNLWCSLFFITHYNE